MREEGLAGDTTKTEARRVHLALRTSGATCRARLGLTSPPPLQDSLDSPFPSTRTVPALCLEMSHGHLDTRSCPTLVLAWSRAPGAAGCWEHGQLSAPKIYYLRPLLFSFALYGVSVVSTTLSFLIPKCPDRCASKFRHQK